jgi:negative regulator of flagellin synthesis FlgM
MNNIQGINGYSGPNAITNQTPSVASGPQAAKQVAESQDSVEISQIARFMNEIAMMPEIRTEKVNAIREALANGTYDVEGNLSAALDRLLEEHPIE